MVELAVRLGTLPYDWDPTTGLSQRLIPGRPGGMGATTSLNHDRNGKACYDAERNQRGHSMRSRKLAALQQSLHPPRVHGAPEGDLLLGGWGSTRGAIEEAARREQAAVASAVRKLVASLTGVERSGSERSQAVRMGLALR